MSSDSKSFPLLFLPAVAAEHLIRTMEVSEMFILSLTSTRARALLNYCLPKNYAHICCSFFGHKTFDIQFFPGRTRANFMRLFLEQEQYHVSRTGGCNSYKIHDIQCKLFLSRNNPMKVISEKPFEDVAQALLTHLAESFHTPKISIEFGSVMAPGAALRFLNYAKSLNLSVEKLMLGTTNTPAEVYRAFSNEGPNAKELVIVSDATPDFQYSPSEVFKLDKFHVCDGHWVHLQDFMECRSIVVLNITAKPNMYCMNAKRLNEFFKAWQRSSCRLESLKLWERRSHGLDFEKVIMGLNGTTFVTTDGIQSVDIEREDGRKSVITLTRRFLKLEKIN